MPTLVGTTAAIAGKPPKSATADIGTIDKSNSQRNRRKLIASTKRRYSKEEFARRGDAVYESDARPCLKTNDEGKFAAIDIESGAYEINSDELAACEKLSSRIPEAQIWLVRISSRYLHRFGGREKRASS